MGVAPAKSFMDPEEAKWGERLIAAMEKYLDQKFKAGQTQRMFHPQMHGCVFADFIVEPNLPEDLKVGIFAQETTRAAWIRFSNSTWKDDIKKNFRGMAVKVICVDGEKLIQQDKPYDTQDFVLVNWPTLGVSSYIVAVRAILALVGTIFDTLYFAFRYFGAVLETFRVVPCFNLLETQYYSQVPSKFGDRAVKYSVIPHKKKTSTAPKKPLPDYLRARLADDLVSEEASFDFCIQFQTDPKTMPIENPSVEWKSPFIKLATIRIAKQLFNQDDQWQFGKSLTYNPWHALPEHEPLSAVNRIRGYVYEQMSAYRHKRNHVTYSEPGPESFEMGRLLNKDNVEYEPVFVGIDSTAVNNIILSEEHAKMLKTTENPELVKLRAESTSFAESLEHKLYLHSKNRVYQFEFTAISKIRTDGTHLAELRTLLDKIGTDIKGNGLINFGQFALVHFCRWFIIDNAKEPDLTLISPTLAFNIIFDGDQKIFFDQLFDHWGQGLDAIFSHCEGYDAIATTDTKIAWLLKNNNKPRNFWTAAMGRTVTMIQMEAMLHDALETRMDIMNKEHVGATPPAPGEVFTTLNNYIFDNPEMHFALHPPAKPSFGKIMGDLLRAIGNIGVVSLLLCPTWLACVFLGLSCWTLFISPLLIGLILALIFLAIENPKVKPPVNKPITNVVELEDRQFQNQLTVYGTVKRPNWFHTNFLRMVLVISSIQGRYKATKGDLGGIITIHFLSWHMFNKGRNTMFLSNYDGGWESYLSEFIDEAGYVMNISFGNLIGYPAMKWLFWSGAYNEQVFKTVVRDFQYPCPIWYSAYPMLSIRNILINSQIRQGFSQNMNEKELAEWLKLF